MNKLKFLLILTLIFINKQIFSVGDLKKAIDKKDNKSLANNTNNKGEKTAQTTDKSIFAKASRFAKASQDKSTDNKEEESEPECELELLDQVESEVVYLGSDNASHSIIITEQDIKRRGFDGQLHTRQRLEDEVLADQFSKILKATISNDEVNRNLKKMGLGEKQIIEIADKWGYPNIEEFYEDIKKIYRANGALNFEIESQLIVNEEEIKSYYNQHLKEFEKEGFYLVETAFIEFEENKPKEKIKLELEKYLAGKISKPSFVIWDEPVKIMSGEISSANEFLTNLKIAEIYLKEVDNGFVLYRLKFVQPKEYVPVNEVKEVIVLKLKDIKYDEVLQKIKEKLRRQAIIFNPSIAFPVPCNSQDLGL